MTPSHVQGSQSFCVSLRAAPWPSLSSSPSRFPTKRPRDRTFARSAPRCLQVRSIVPLTGAVWLVVLLSLHSSPQITPAASLPGPDSARSCAAAPRPSRVSAYPWRPVSPLLTHHRALGPGSPSGVSVHSPVLHGAQRTRPEVVGNRRVQPLGAGTAFLPVLQCMCPLVNSHDLELALL